MVKKITPIFKRAASHLFTKPATTKYPFVKPTLPPEARGKMIYEITDCNCIDFGSGKDFRLDVHSIVGSNCHVCERDCPTEAIKVVETEGKKRIQIDLNRCIFCHQCVETCPRKAIKSSDFYELATTDKNAVVMKPSLKVKEEKQ